MVPRAFTYSTPPCTIHCCWTLHSVPKCPLPFVSSSRRGCPPGPSRQPLMNRFDVLSAGLANWDCEGVPSVGFAHRRREDFGQVRSGPPQSIWRDCQRADNLAEIAGRPGTGNSFTGRREWRGRRGEAVEELAPQRIGEGRRLAG